MNKITILKVYKCSQNITCVKFLLNQSIPTVDRYMYGHADTPRSSDLGKTEDILLQKLYDISTEYVFFQQNIWV